MRMLPQQRVRTTTPGWQAQLPPHYRWTFKALSENLVCTEQHQLQKLLPHHSRHNALFDHSRSPRARALVLPNCQSRRSSSSCSSCSTATVVDRCCFLLSSLLSSCLVVLPHLWGRLIIISLPQYSATGVAMDCWCAKVNRCTFLDLFVMKWLFLNFWGLLECHCCFWSN